jgi:hypothetical protein
LETIDVIVPSSSRFYCLKPVYESLQKNLSYSGELRFILHEDIIVTEPSKKLIEWAQGKFDIIKAEPRIGFGPSVSWLWNQVISKYFLYWEDDYELVKPLDLDVVVNLMDNNSNINQIAFHKRPIKRERHWFIKKEVCIDGIDLSIGPHWAFTPAIWRNSYIKKYIPVGGINGNPAWGLNDCIHKSFDGIPGLKWYAEDVEQRMGHYYLGRVGEGHYTEDLAFEDSRVKDQIDYSIEQ